MFLFQGFILESLTSLSKLGQAISNQIKMKGFIFTFKATEA